MKILITGGTGFIGSHLTDALLKENHEISLIARNLDKIKNISKNSSKIKVEQIDVTDVIHFENYVKENKPDVIFHLAGNTSHKQSFANPIYDVDVNIKSTMCILESIRKHNPTCKLLLGSTFIVVGKPENLPVTEESKCTPTTIYGANRLTSEYLCNIYHNVYGLDTMSFRITNSFGPREQSETPSKNALNYLIHQAFLGENVTIYDEGKFFRDIIFVEDVVSGLITILKYGKPGNLYWISSNKKTWFYEIGEWLSEFTNGKISYVESPNYTKKVDVGNFVVDNSKLCSLGWKPKISVKDGIKQTLDFFSSEQ